MSIRYAKITTSTTEPASPGLGDMWVREVDDSYQVYMYLNDWYPLTGGGVVITETGADNHYINVIIQEDPPTDIKPGWIWIKESILQAYIHLFKDSNGDNIFVLLIGA